MLTLSDFKRRHQKRLLRLRLAYSALLLTVIVSVLSLTGCATNSPPPACSCPTLPALPSALTPQPAQTYSASVRQLLSTWRAKLTATPLTP